jgi:hypothetical protein
LGEECYEYGNNTSDFSTIDLVIPAMVSSNDGQTKFKTFMSNNAFRGTYSVNTTLAGSVTFSEGTKQIGKGSSDGLWSYGTNISGITSINLPSSLEVLKDYSLIGGSTSNYVTIDNINIPKNLKTIGKYVFDNVTTNLIVGHYDELPSNSVSVNAFSGIKNFNSSAKVINIGKVSATDFLT